MYNLRWVAMQVGALNPIAQSKDVLMEVIAKFDDMIVAIMNSAPTYCLTLPTVELTTLHLIAKNLLILQKKSSTIKQNKNYKNTIQFQRKNEAILLLNKSRTGPSSLRCWKETSSAPINKSRSCPPLLSLWALFGKRPKRSQKTAQLMVCT